MSLNIQTNVTMPQNNMAFKANKKQEAFDISTQILRRRLLEDGRITKNDFDFRNYLDKYIQKISKYFTERT